MQRTSHDRAVAALLCAALFISLFPGKADAAVYYVDFASGSDSNNGTSTNTPWQHCPGDAGASHVAATNGLRPGDWVTFKGGVPYSDAVILNWSGTVGNPITYDGNSAGTFGTGRAQFNGNYTNRNGFTTSGYTKTNLTFLNCEFCFLGGHPSITWTPTNVPAAVESYGISVANASGMTISNCYFHDIGDWTNAVGMSTGFMDGYAIYLYNSSSSIVITNCEFTKIGQAGVMVWPAYPNVSATNIYIGGCNFHDWMRWGIVLSPTGNSATMQDITIDNCQFHEFYYYAAGTWLGLTNDNPHADSIFLFLGGSPIATNCSLGTPQHPITIKNCFFYTSTITNNTENYSGTACIYTDPWGGTLLIYNNVFVSTLYHGVGGVSFYDNLYPTNGSTQPDFQIYNNSFYDNTYMVYLRSAAQACALTNGTVRIKNNIFYKADNGAAYGVEFGLDPYSSPTELDYNLYVTLRPDNTLAHISTNGVTAYYTLAQLQAMGYEQHGLQANPQYVNLSYGLGINSGLNDLHLLGNSPAIGAGTNLSFLFGFDKDGRQRYPTGNWDMGAYTYRSPIAAPTDLRIVGP